MSAHIEKILLGLAVLILLGGVGVSFTMGGDGAKSIKDEITEADLTGEPYEPIVPPTVNFQHQEWNEPPYQDVANEAWQYGVFTPPKIYIDPRTGVLIEEPPVPPVVIPFGLRLVTMTHPDYPITIEAYFDSSTGDPMDASLTLYHNELGLSSGIVGVGDRIEEWGVVITDLDVDKRGDSTMGFETVATVTVKDEKFGRSFSFSPGEVVKLDDKNIITVKPIDPPGGEKVWREVGDTLAHAGSTYTLLEFDFDKRTITVKKESPALEEPETLTLIEKGSPSTSSSPKTKEASSTPEKTEQSNDSSEDKAVDDLFQNMF